jgi:hypothetical protein
MPRIPDVHLQSVVFIYPSEQDAQDGRQLGGSGFVVNYPTGVGAWRTRYVVTNAHVVEAGGQWMRLNHRHGTHTVHIPPDQWETAPPDDFAIALLSLPPRVTPMELALDKLAVTLQQARRPPLTPENVAPDLLVSSALGGTRTPNLLIRSQMLYPLSYERWCLASLRHSGRVVCQSPAGSWGSAS